MPSREHVDSKREVACRVDNGAIRSALGALWSSWPQKTQ